MTTDKMTTPTWEPVEQYVLAGEDAQAGILMPSETRAVCRELLTARALLVALAEALDRLRVTAGRDLYDAAGIYYHATQAIEAHVRRHRQKDEAAMRDDVALSLSGPQTERRWK